MNAADIKKQLYLDVACILEKDDDLMPSEFDDDSREAKAWIKARDNLTKELRRRSGQLV